MMYHESMVPNARFWAHYFRQAHVQVIQDFRAGALEKVAPAFSSIAEEADAAAEAEFERLGSMPGDPDGSIDMGDVAEWATDHGIKYYETMSGVRQVVLNVLAVGLHHLFEQQLSFLWQKLVKGKAGSFQAVELEKRLAACGVECRKFACTGKLYELRMAANAIKHGAGGSANKLARLRPDLFENPTLSHFGWTKGAATKSRPAAALDSSPFSPLAGIDLYVSERDLSEWCDAVMAYWEELSAVLDEQEQQQSVD